MNEIFKKLNYKNQEIILVMNPPSSFRNELLEMSGHCQVFENIDDLNEVKFALVFATSQEEVDQTIFSIYPKITGDAILWFSYPKSSSRKYSTEINRDKGWASLGKLGFEPVRQVAIDDDWSALRFRKVEFIRNITRSESFALSEGAKKRIARNRK